MRFNVTYMKKSVVKLITHLLRSSSKNYAIILDAQIGDKFSLRCEMHNVKQDKK